MKTKLLLLVLLTTLLFFNCKERKNERQNSVPDIVEESRPREQNTQSDSSENQEHQEEQSAEQNITPEILFPVETWLTDVDIHEPVEAIHPLIGALLPLEPGKDELALYEQSLDILEQLPVQNTQNYYPAIGLALKIKIEHLELQGDSLIGNPLIQGATAEVPFVVTQKEEEGGGKEFKGTFYWIFEDNRWFLEDMTIH